MAELVKMGGLDLTRSGLEAAAVSGGSACVFTGQCIYTVNKKKSEINGLWQESSERIYGN